MKFIRNGVCEASLHLFSNYYHNHPKKKRLTPLLSQNLLFKTISVQKYATNLYTGVSSEEAHCKSLLPAWCSII